MATKSLAARLLPKALQDDIDRQIEPHLRQRATGSGVCSTKTARERRLHIRATVAELWKLGFHIQKLDSLDKRHIESLMSHWDAVGLSPEFLHNRASVLRTLAGWLGKRHLVGDLEEYFPKERTRRRTATDEDLSWKAKGVDPLKVIAAAKLLDERLAVMLSMQHALGLRVKESIELRPANVVVDGGAAVEVFAGTKGGKLRRIAVDTEYKRETIAWARRVAASGNTGRLRWPDTTWRQAQNRYYYLARVKLKIGKDLSGFTSHGLRHEWSHEGYEARTGFPPPVVVGKRQGKPVPPPGLDREMHQQASMEVSRELGHGRLDVTPSYYGTYGHGFRTSAPPDNMKVTLNGQAV